MHWLVFCFSCGVFFPLLICIYDFFFFFPSLLCVRVCAFSFKQGMILMWSLSRYKRFSLAFVPCPAHQLRFAREVRDVRGLNLSQLLLQQPLPGAVGPAWQETSPAFPAAFTNPTGARRQEASPVHSVPFWNLAEGSCFLGHTTWQGRTAIHPRGRKN